MPLCRSEVRSESPRALVNASPAASPGGFRGESISCLSSVWALLHDWTPGQFLHLHSQHLLLSLTLLPPPFSYKDPVITLGPAW